MALQASVVFLLIACFWAASQVSGNTGVANDCCLKVSKKEIPLKNVRCYRVQDEVSGCNIRAVVFTTRKNKNLCAPPGEPWVIILKNKVKVCKNKRKH
ncbi:C-C motif chemokine 19-like [Discoglossus pictus]